MRPRVVILVDDEGNEIILPKKQIPSDFFRKGIILWIIESVELKGNKPQIIMSRTSETFWKII
jgi:N utilization substance protein A